MFGKYEPAWFGNIILTMKTLFVIILEGWSWIYDLSGINTAMANGLSDLTISLYFISFIFIGAMIFLNLFIGVITAEIQESKIAENQGRSKIFKTNHTIIIGWSQKIFKVVSELVEANKSESRANIVILADRDKSDMEFDILSKIKDTYSTNIICKRGSPLNAAHLEIVNPRQAKSIILLGDDDSKQPDLNIIKVLMALTKDQSFLNNNCHIVAEIQNDKFLPIAHNIAVDKAVFIKVDSLISRIIAQTCLQHRLAKIYSEIIGFQGSEIYLTEHKELIGKYFKDIMFMYESSIPLGILKNNKDSQLEDTLLNPFPDSLFEEGDKLVILAQDDSTITIKKNKKKNNNTNILINPVFDLENTTRPKKILLLGWNHKVPLVLNELIEYLPKDSSIKIITECTDSLGDFDLSKYKDHNIKIELVSGDITDLAVLTNALTEDINHILIMSYIDKIKNIQEADALTLISLIQLRKIQQESGRNFSILTEIIDLHNMELASKDDSNDFIVSAEINSSIMAQLSENKDLSKVFDIIFSSIGSEIYIRPVKYYLDLNNKIEIDFNAVISASLLKGDIAIGYIVNNNGKYIEHLNPLRSKKFQLKESDKIIVLSKEEIFENIHKHDHLQEFKS